MKAVIFDWGGTLTPWHPVDLREQWRVFSAALHAHEDTTPGGAAHVEQLAEDIFAAESRAWARSRDEWLSARLADMLAEAGVRESHARWEVAHAAYQAFWEPHTHTDPAVGPLWRTLKGMGIRIGVLSNTLWSRDYHRSVFARDGVLDLIDADLYTSEISWSKPHPNAFRAAAESLDVEPQDCVYVGDRLYEDVHGPQQVGMRAVWIPHSDLPAEQIVAVDNEPDAVVHALPELAGIVHGWQANTTSDPSSG